MCAAATCANLYFFASQQWQGCGGLLGVHGDAWGGGKVMSLYPPCECRILPESVIQFSKMS